MAGLTTSYYPQNAGAFGDGEGYPMSGSASPPYNEDGGSRLPEWLFVVVGTVYRIYQRAGRERR